MADLQLTAAAVADLDEIDAYGARHFGEDAANAYAAGLHHAFDLLATFPHLAPLRPDFGVGIRSRTFRAHLLLHVVAENCVVVIRILHHSRDVASELQS